jgi:hypothetical protein
VSPGARKLAVLVDGVAMEETAALAFWERFSAWMEEHRGDLAGFAVQEGYASVHPGVNGDRPVLRASKSVAQQPYSTVRAEASGGSAARHDPARKPDRPSSHPRNVAGKQRK